MREPGMGLLWCTGSPVITTTSPGFNSNCILFIRRLLDRLREEEELDDDALEEELDDEALEEELDDEALDFLFDVVWLGT
jgi:hypothetical protein